MRSRLLSGPATPILGKAAAGGYVPGDIVFSQVSPGSLWLPADGRAISKAANSALHATLPLAHPAPVKLALPNNNVQMRSVIYFAGLYVLQGLSGTYTSPDLANFTSIGNPVSNANRTVVGASGFMLFGDGSAVYNTTGNNQWTASTFESGGNSSYTGTFGLGLFLSQNGSSGLKWLTEGQTTWNACAFDDGTTGLGNFGVGCIEFINGQFLCCDTSGRLYKSSNGKGYTAISGANNVKFNRIFYYNGFYYGHSNNSSVVQKSSDLINWTTVYNSYSANGVYLGYNAALSNGIMLCTDTSTSTPRFQISYNLVDFLLLPMSPTTTNYNWAGADFANGKMFIIGNNAANVVFSAPMPSNDDDRNLPLIKMRTPAWIKAA